MIFINPEAYVNRDIPNLGLAYAATHYKVKVLDFNTKPYPKDRLVEEETNVLGISVQTRTFKEAEKIREQYLQKFPEAEVKSIEGFIDIQCCYPFINFEEKISYDKPFSDEYPFPDYELFDSFDIFLKNWQSGEWRYPILTSLGCPYQCTYCESRNRKWLTRSVDDCFEELKTAKKKWAIKSFAVIDDCFNVDRKRVINFCDKTASLNLKWTCANGLRADNFDEKIATKMKESGCDFIGFGIETIDDHILKVIKKGETFAQIDKSVKIAKKYFNKINAFFIIGLPYSSFLKDRKNLQYVYKNGLIGTFSYYIPPEYKKQLGTTFYGEKAVPISNRYNKFLQRLIYWLSTYHREKNRVYKIIIKISQVLFLHWI